MSVLSRLCAGSAIASVGSIDAQELFGLGAVLVECARPEGCSEVNPRALLVSPLGFLIGVSLGALGGGGSILAVPVLVYAAGETPQAATTTSLVVVGATALGGMFAHLRAGHVRVLPGVVFGLAGIGGALLGTRLNDAVNANVLLLAFAGLMLIAAWRMWANQTEPGAGDEDFVPYPEASAATGVGAATDTATTQRLQVTTVVAAKVLAAGSVVGFITGFFGVGGGFVIVPALVLTLGFGIVHPLTSRARRRRRPALLRGVCSPPARIGPRCRHGRHPTRDVTLSMNTGMGGTALRRRAVPHRRTQLRREPMSTSPPVLAPPRTGSSTTPHPWITRSTSTSGPSA